MKRILIIGGGSIGERHLRCFQKTGRVELGLCEISDDLRERLRVQYELPDVFAKLDDAIATGFDAAVVCVPAHLHINPVATRLVELDWDLLMEKPLCTSLAEIPPFVDLVKQRGIKLMMAFTYRSHPALAAMKEALDSGRFGNPVQVSVVSGQHFPFYRPAYREIYYTKRETGGGLTQDMFPHPLNAVEWLVGPLTSVYGDASHRVLDGVEVDDTLSLFARHGEVVATYSLNQHQAPNETVITVVCDKGTVRFQYHESRWLSCVEPGQDWEVELKCDLERDDIFVSQAETFLDLIEGKTEEPLCSLSEGAQTLAATLATLRSSDENKVIKL